VRQDALGKEVVGAGGVQVEHRLGSFGSDGLNAHTSLYSQWGGTDRRECCFSIADHDVQGSIGPMLVLTRRNPVDLLVSASPFLKGFKSPWWSSE
jgi:hypothetical protein